MRLLLPLLLLLLSSVALGFTATTLPSSAVVYVPTSTSTNKNLPFWQSLVPSLLDNPRGLDVTVQWTCHPPQSASSIQRDCQKAAAEWMRQAAEQCRSSSSSLAPAAQSTLGNHNHDDSKVQNELATAMAAFCTYCHDHSLPNDNTFRARIVCGRGPTSAKCPKWHVDHVPVRWIQSLVGPGCEWTSTTVSCDNNHTDDDDDDVVNNNDTLNLNIRNRQVVPQGQAVLVHGNRWPGPEPPCLHKSPSNIPPWQGRVLFTMDVVAREEKEGNGSTTCGC